MAAEILTLTTAVREAIANTEWSDEERLRRLKRSAAQALGPINGALRALSSIKLRELPEDKRKAIEAQIKELEEYKKTLRKFYAQLLSENGEPPAS